MPSTGALSLLLALTGSSGLDPSGQESYDCCSLVERIGNLSCVLVSRNITRIPGHRTVHWPNCTSVPGEARTVVRCHEPAEPDVCFAYACFDEPLIKLWVRSYRPLRTISFPFLVITVLVLAAKDLNMFEMSLMHHTICRIIISVSMLIVRTDINNHIAACYILAYSMQFSFLAIFSWLNLMCFDVFSAFRRRTSVKIVTGSAKDKKRKKKILYSLYGWGFPLLVLIITSAADYSPLVPKDSVWKPNIAINRCFFKDNKGTEIYLYIPLSFTVFINIILFFFTAFRICAWKRETAVLKKEGSRKHYSKKDEERFSLYSKLFIEMVGINWSLEIISFLGDHGRPSYIWCIIDFTNLIQAIFIFTIFVWKKSELQLVVGKMSRILRNPRTLSQPTSSNLTQKGISMETISSQVSVACVPAPTIPACDTTKPAVIS